MRSLNIWSRDWNSFLFSLDCNVPVWLFFFYLDFHVPVWREGFATIFGWWWWMLDILILSPLLNGDDWFFDFASLSLLLWINLGYLFSIAVAAVVSLHGVYDKANRLGVLGMGDFKLVTNSAYSEAKLVFSENSGSLYSEVAWWFEGFSFRN